MVTLSVPELDTKEGRRKYVTEIMAALGVRPQKWGKRNVRFDVPVLTPEIAAKLLVLRFRQRPVNMVHVATLAEAMREGRWKVTGLPVVFDEDWFLIDGQHRLEAVVKSNTPMLDAVVQAVDEEGVFLVVDMNGNPRKPTDVVRYITGKSVSRTVLAAILMELYDFHDAPDTLQRSQKGELVAHYDLLEDARNLYNWSCNKTHATSGAIAAALRAVRLDGAQARLFFACVFTNRHTINDKQSLAAQRLSTWLVNQYVIQARKGEKKAARGSTGFKLQQETAERVAYEYLAWKNGDRKKSGPAKLEGSMPAEFAVSEGDLNLARMRKYIEEAAGAADQ
jgi:hypothetical protein